MEGGRDYPLDYAARPQEIRRQKADDRRTPGGAAPPQTGALGDCVLPNRRPPITSWFLCGTETQSSGVAGLVAQLKQLKQERRQTGRKGYDQLSDRAGTFSATGSCWGYRPSDPQQPRP